MTTTKTKKTTKQESATEVLETTTKLLNIKQPKEFKITEEGRKIIEDFKEYLVNNGNASATVKSYIYDIHSFIEFIESEGIIFTGEFNITQYTDYIKLQTEQSFKPNTINKRINSLQQFNIFLLMNKLMPGVIIILKIHKLPV